MFALYHRVPRSRMAYDPMLGNHDMVMDALRMLSARSSTHRACCFTFVVFTMSLRHSNLGLASYCHCNCHWAFTV